MRLCIGLALAILLTGSVHGITREATINEGDSYIFTVVTLANSVEKCHLKTPLGEVIDFVPGDETQSGDKYVIGQGNLVSACELTLKNADKNDDGSWEMYFTHAGGTGSSQMYIITVILNDVPEVDSEQSDEKEQESTTEENTQTSDEQSKSEENNTEEIILLSEIVHFTKLNDLIDISLSKESFNEDCFIRPPNGEMVKSTFFTLDNVSVRSKSEFVSCRITIHMVEDLTGDWQVCGVSELNGAMRCQPAKIQWYNTNEPAFNWGAVTQMKVDHPVHFGGSVNPGVTSRGISVLTCHVVTPHGEDLVIKHDTNYPHIVRTELNNPSLCAVSFDIDVKMLGEWVIYGMFFAGSTQQEVRLPMSFYVYNTHDPYEQAYNVTVLAESDHPVANGGTYTEIIPGTGKIDECVYVTPTHDVFNLENGPVVEGVILTNLENQVACQLNIDLITYKMFGTWQLIVKSNDGAQFYETQRIFTLVEKVDSDTSASGETQEISDESVEEPEDADTTVLREINHYTRQEANIDISLNKETFEEECYVRPPGGEMTRVDLLEMEGVTVQSPSNFVSCRITIGPMTEDLIGSWRLCGKSQLNGKSRCQPVNIAWNSHNGIANWGTVTQLTSAQPVNFGGSVHSGAGGFGDISSCHVITPAGEDLVVSTDVKYPHIDFVEASQHLCSIIFSDISEDMLGNWIIIGRFRSIVEQTENRHPLRFFLYNEEDPYAQAYNVTELQRARHLVHEGGALTLEVSQRAGVVRDCIYKTPTGLTYDISTYEKNTIEGVTFKSSDTGAWCQIIFSSITKETAGQWQIAGKFNNGVLFDRIDQTFEIIIEDPANPIEDDKERQIEYLTEQVVYTQLDATQRIVINAAASIENESCHIITPSGLQYAFIDGFNVPGVEIINTNGVECGVTVTLREEAMVGTWTLLARATRLFEHIERRQPFTIRVEENFVIQNDISITEGADLYLHLNYAVTAADTCTIYGPDGEVYNNAEKDPVYQQNCGYIVKNVDHQHTGTWIIEYGANLKFRGSVAVHVLATQDITVDDLRWTIGSSVDITLGPADAIFCKIEDPYKHIVFAGFGQCKIGLDRVVLDHGGVWHMYVGVPGTVLMRTVPFSVHIQTRDGKPIVTTAVEKSGSSVMMSCTIPNEHEVNACTFMTPRGDVLVATHGVGEEGYMFNGSFVNNYESNTHSHDCTLRLVNPVASDQGIWRCGMQTSTGTYYGFLTILCPHLDLDPSIVTEPVLRSEQVLSFEENEPAVMSCSIQTELRYCYFRSRNGTTFNVFPSMSSSLSYEYAGAGLDAGECGIRFKSGLAVSDFGTWSCHVGLARTTTEEQRVSFDVDVRAKMTVSHYWYSSILWVLATVNYPYTIDYCRFVRIDGYGFTSDLIPSGYELGQPLNSGHCSLLIKHPTVLDLHPWTIAVKTTELEGEISMTTTENLLNIPDKPNISGEILFWSLIVFICLVPALAASALIPKKNREWTYRRASSVRNSFRNSWNNTFTKKPLPEKQTIEGQV